MGAPEGNQFWKARAKHGRPKLFERPEYLWLSCLEYFEWVENNPLLEQKVFASQGDVVRADVTKMRPMTIGGLCIFLDIDRSTWTEWRSKGDDYSTIVKQAEAVIRDQKFAGAAAGLLNANIIARDLGLSEKTENAHTITPSEEELNAKLREHGIDPDDV